MIGRIVEAIEPEDTRDDLRAEIAHVLDHGRLKPGSSLDRLRLLANYASGRPGPRSIRELNMNPATSPDWLDCVAAIERKLSTREIDPSITIVDGASDGPNRAYHDERAFVAAQEKRADAMARKAQADQTATVESITTAKQEA